MYEFMFIHVYIFIYLIYVCGTCICGTCICDGYIRAGYMFANLIVIAKYVHTSNIRYIASRRWPGLQSHLGCISYSRAAIAIDNKQ